MVFPVLRLRGDPYEQGLGHGEELEDRISRNLDVYFNRYERESLLSRDDVLDRAHKYSNAIKGQSPNYFDAMRGIAEGSGFDLEEIVALNVRYEIMYYQISMRAMRDGCTVFAVSPEASENGHLLMGQNWDWIPEVQGAIIHATDPDGLEVLSFTEAGIVDGKFGLNSAGLGMTVSGLHTTDDDWSRMTKPLHVRCHEILRSRDIQEAVRIVTGEKRACSTNLLIAQTPNRIVDVEAAPDGTRILHPEKGRIVHANHFLDPKELDVVEPPIARRKYSFLRQDRLRKFLDSKRLISIKDLEVYLRDHEDSPYSLCRHPDTALPEEERYVTVASVIMDLDAKLMHVSDGQPCENEYQAVSLM